MTWLKFAPYIAGLALLVFLWSFYVHKIDEADAAGYARALRVADAERAVERLANDKRRQESSREYESNMESLQSRVDALSARPPVVRVCKPSTEVRIPKTTGSADGAADAGSALQAGPDIGGSLVLYARDCESTRRQLSALQEWISGLE